jgi:hypothetical protein
MAIFPYEQAADAGVVNDHIGRYPRWEDTPSEFLQIVGNPQRSGIDCGTRF